MGDFVTMDYAEFDKALVEYSAATGKTLADSCTRQCGNWAVKASAVVKRGSREAIRALWSLPDRKWYKFIQHVINSKGFLLHGRRKARGAERDKAWFDFVSGRTMDYRKSVATSRLIGTEWGMFGSNRRDVARTSRAIIKRRAATVKSLVAALGYAGASMGRLLSGFGHKSTPGANPKYIVRGLVTKPATPANISASFEIPFSGKPREDGGGNQSERANRKAEMCQAALVATQSETIADMVAYTQERLAKDADKWSARS